jgi:hypothetical protein
MREVAGFFGRGLLIGTGGETAYLRAEARRSERKRIYGSNNVKREQMDDVKKSI